MNYLNFKDQVLSYSDRLASTFTSAGSQDLVLSAMNDARRAAQRQYTFNLNRQPVFGSLSIVGTSLLTGLTLTPGGSVVVVKQVDAVYEYITVASGQYARTAKIRFLRHSAFENELNYSATTFGNVSTNPVRQNRNIMQFVYQQGTSLYHATNTAGVSYWLDAIVMLPDHAGDSVEDVFLTYFVDWLKYATILNLNQFLKDDDRFKFDSSFVDGLWESVKQYDAQQGASTGAIDLD